MKRLLALFFLFIHLLVNTEIREFVKLDAFISHYYEHCETDKHLTVLEFINIHYFGSNQIDKDYEKDMELPFKAHDCSSHSPLPSLISLSSFKLLSPFQFSGKELFYYHQTTIPLSCLIEIWHPPKSC